MHQDIVQLVRNHPRYGELIGKRSRFAWILTTLILVVYYGFIVVIAFDKSLLGLPLAKGAVTTIGIPIGIFIIAFAFVLTGVYVQRANREFDDITNQIKKDVQ